MDQQQTAEDLMEKDRFPSVGAWIIGVACLVGVVGVLLGLAAISESSNIGSTTDPSTGWVIIGASVVQALFIAAIGSAVSLLRSIAVTNARMVILLREAVGFQQGN